MNSHLIIQPGSESSSAASFLKELAADAAVQRIDIVVAWAKRSGFVQVSQALKEFTGRGGILRIVTGISQQGATRQGLELALKLATEAYVFHQPSRTFHPKLYAGHGVDLGRFLIGSQNLTRGGLVSNFELGLSVTIGASDSDGDKDLLAAIQEYVDSLINDRAACKRLTDETLAILLQDARYGVGDEDSDRSTRLPPEASSLWSDSDGGSLFSRSTLTLPSDIDAGSSDREPWAEAEVVPITVVRRWYKLVPASNVSRVGGNTNPQGHLTLTRGPQMPHHDPHPIRAKTFFREEFFSEAAWQPSASGRSEVATVDVHVKARGIDMGNYELVVEHNQSFDSGQGNRTTFLHWGSVLSEYLRKQVDHTGDVVTLEKLSDSSYRLTFAAEPTGPFL